MRKRVFPKLQKKLMNILKLKSLSLFCGIFHTHKNYYCDIMRLPRPEALAQVRHLPAPGLIRPGTQAFKTEKNRKCHNEKKTRAIYRQSHLHASKFNCYIIVVQQTDYQ